ncbi:hypothetical protein [Mucilaginibacter myungsuensis]|nr:hypothetical protein [Mucilaginibacter myungsuensis]
MGEEFKQFTFTEVVSILNNFEFKYEWATEQHNSPFFKEYSNLYNTDPILLRCTCKDSKLFSEIIKSLDFFEQEKHGYRCLENDVIKSLITNLYLNPGPSPIAEFTDGVDWERFKSLSFEKISPTSFVVKLQELIQVGGLFEKSKQSSDQIKNLALDFSNSIFKENIKNFKIYYTFDEGWSDYFGKMGMGLDVTFFLFDGTLGEFWILSKTDYD